jgi:2-O-methyltransferase
MSRIDILFKRAIDKWFSRSALKFQDEVGVIPKSYIAKFIPPDPIIIEGGAHVGLDTIGMSKMWPKGYIHAFEPVPYLYQRLAHNTKKLRNVGIYQLALGDINGRSKIYLSNGTSDASSSLLKPKEHLSQHPSVLFEDSIEIQVITLDTWAKNHSIEKIDFLWLDLQGYELRMLKASPKILQSVKAIYTEVSLKELYEGCPLYPEMACWFEEQGFRIGQTLETCYLLGNRIAN